MGHVLKPTVATSRRGLLAGVAAAGVVAGTAVRAEGAGAIQYSEYEAFKPRGAGRVQLQMYRKRLAPEGGVARPVLFLVHGSSPAALSSFDLQAPGHGEYSLMDVFARYGFDVWTMDHEGYGRSERTETNSDIASGVQDLVAGAAVVERESGQRTMHMMGESSGALRAGAFAMAEPARMGRLVLEAFTYTGEGSPTLAKRVSRPNIIGHITGGRGTRRCCSASLPVTNRGRRTRRWRNCSPRRRSNTGIRCRPGRIWT